MSVELFSLLVAILNLIAVLELVRRRQMQENFALLWMGIALGGFVLVLARPLVDAAAEFFGLGTGASMVFAGGILFLLIVCMYLSLQVSKLSARVERLAEEFAFQRGVEEPATTKPAGEERTGE